jgi:transposase InsO family protein
MGWRRGPPSQGWKTFLRNHADGVAAIDLFVVPTISFRLLYGLLIMGHGRRQILWLGVTTHPTAEWLANQLTAACGWEQILRYLIRDRDACYGTVFVRRVRSLGIRDHPTSARSPWQNAYAERLIGSIRRECLDHIIVVGEQHLRHVLMCYMEYYNPNASLIEQGCAHSKGHSARRLYRSTAHPWWAAPSIHADLICGRDRSDQSNIRDMPSKNSSFIKS